jgi:tRNA A37 methylthiotransferase MiaB
MMTMKKVYMEAYGCSSNLADSEIIAGLLKQHGFELVNAPTEANVNIIVTCNVKLPTSHKMIHRIKQLTKLNKPLVVAGCMPKTERDIIEKINPKASLLGPDSVQKVVDVVKAAINGEKIVCLDEIKKPKLCIPRVRKNPIIHITPVASGCLSNCSYCCVKFARGRLFSYPPELIVKD